VKKEREKQKESESALKKDMIFQLDRVMICLIKFDTLISLFLFIILLLSSKFLERGMEKTKSNNKENNAIQNEK